MNTRLVIAVFIISLSLSGCRLFKRNSPEPTPSPTPFNQPVNVIPVSERPYVSLSPNSSGRQLTLTLHNLPKSASELEYELEYQAGTLLQGAFGSLTLDNLPATSDVLLGSCSAGGACSYHEDVQGGSLTLKFKGSDPYALKNEWRFQPASLAGGEFASRDSKFQLDAGRILNSSGFVIVMQTSGLPQEFNSQVLAGPYGIFTPSTLPTGEVDITMRLNEAIPEAKIYGYDGQTWQSFPTTVDDKTATATVELLPVFIAAP